MAPEGLFNPGSVFADKYTIERVLGEGGMGVVYRAVHNRLSQRVAIKTLLPAMLSRPQLVARFEREARAAAQLHSRHAVRVIDVGELPNGLPFMVMEYLEGRDLADELAARGPLPVKEAIDWVLQACTAMAEAHDRGIVHRDIKPSNLFLAEEGGGARTLKVLDFGISKFEDPAAGVALTATEASIGTPLYMSPEQVRSSRDVDRRSDVWSIGVVLFELLTGETPFGGGGDRGAASVGASIVADDAPTLSAMRPDVPKELDLVMTIALAKKRDDRFPDARAFAQALLPFSSTPQPSPSSPFLVRPPDTRMQSMPDAARDPTLDVSSAGARTPLLHTEAGFGQSMSPSKKRAARVGLFGVAAVALVGVALVTLRLRAPAPTDATITSTAHAPEPAPAPPPAPTIVPLPTAPAEAPASAAPTASVPAPAPVRSAAPAIARPRGSTPTPSRPPPNSAANPTRL